jgi:hypothetical protein
MAWINRGSILGPAGPPGVKGDTGQQGTTGARGSQWFTGTGSPGTIAGVVAGDLYLDVNTGNVYQRTASAWSLKGKLGNYVPSAVVAATPSSPEPGVLYFETG